MQYLGGKTRIAKKLADVVNESRRGRPFWDPFCGGLSVSVALSAAGPGLISDSNPALISLYRAVADGWDPPESLSECEYKAAKSLPDHDPLKAFAGFGCSFGGMWFSCYARGKGNYAAATRRSLILDVGLLTSRGCEFAHVDFLNEEPSATERVLYLDPPYRGTAGYEGVAAFDHDRFYGRVAEWSRVTDVFVSEYSMPWGAVSLEFPRNLRIAGGERKNARTERLYRYDSETQARDAN